MWLRLFLNSIFAVYEYENQILTLQNGRSVFGLAEGANETALSNSTRRFLQTEEECNQLWASYVTSAIENEVNIIVP